MSATRPNYHPPPPPPTPKTLLFLPRRINPNRPVPPDGARNLRSLFDEETSSPDQTSENEKWMIEAKMLRVECDFLRMERDAALQKLEKYREREKIDGSYTIEKKMGKLKIEMVKEKMEDDCYLHSGEGYSRRQRLLTAEMANPRQVKETCCHCKEVVGKIAEQVRRESEQWAEIQVMLDQVRLEMEDLRSSRDLWHRRAVQSELNLQALYPHILEWRRRAQASEQKVSELQKHVFNLKKSRSSDATAAITFSENAGSEDWNQMRLPRIRCQQLKPRSRKNYSSTVKENHMLVSRLSDPKRNIARRCSPLKEIGNL